MPDGDEHPGDDDNDGNDGNNEGGVPTLTGRATRDRLVQRYFSGYTPFPNHIILLTYFIIFYFKTEKSLSQEPLIAIIHLVNFSIHVCIVIFTSIRFYYLLIVYSISEACAHATL